MLSPGEMPVVPLLSGRRKPLEDETVEGGAKLSWFSVLRMTVTLAECHYMPGIVQSPLLVLTQLFPQHSSEVSVAPRD